MRKYGIAIILMLILVCALSLISSLEIAKGQEKIKVICNDKAISFDVKPSILKNKVYVPFRNIFEALDAQVVWDEETSTIKATTEQSDLVIDLENNTAKINGDNVSLEDRPIIENSRILVPLRFVSEALYARVSWNGSTKTVLIEKGKLPVVGTYENLKKLLESSAYVQRSMRKEMAKSTETAITSAVADQAASEAGSSDYSATNIQVQGVDEGDIIKTDGKYIYQVNNNRVIIVLAAPAEKMTITDTINFTNEEFSPQELYVDKKHLVVIGSSDGSRLMDQPKISPEANIYPPVSPTNTLKVIIFDITDKNDISKIREVELEGNYVSSRKVDSQLYLTANKYLDYYYMTEGQETDTVPLYRDTKMKDEYIKIPYQEICYFPGRLAPNYLLVAGLDLDQPDQEMKVSAYLGAGENIYVTENNLYVAVTGYQGNEAEQAKRILPQPETLDINTLVYKFSLNQGEVKYSAQGEVPGTILNQFSMDEYKGYFRIATTKGDTWRDDEYTSKNNVYILDENMKITGKIEDIAPGEKIYSVRFMGGRGYMVTFKKVDPLFVIDLNDPKEPKILGALKIPGYSDYLHPYDENHIIGLGKDTVELSQKDGQGNETGTMAFYQGMKIALFDVSNVAHPIQKYQEIIGDRGTDSDLLHNHKALLFSREKNLMAFPVTVMEIKNKTSVQNNIPEYGEIAYQGAYVYQVDLTKGFVLKGAITHLDPEDLVKAGYNWYSSNRNVERIIYIGDTLYTLSKGMIKAHSLNDLKEITSMVIPQ
ncbi:MAG: beta-propeller domain-containing protein [Dehalobacterium sp.]